MNNTANRRTARRKQSRRHPIVHFFKLLLLILMLLLLSIGIIIFVKVFPEFRRLQERALETYSHMSEEDFRLVTDTEIYDRDNQLVGVINTGHYIYVPFDEISPWLKKAYIDQEDRRFYSHNGVDLVAMARASLSYLKNRRVTQGGSTITQQVIKNTYLTQERTLERKLTEILIAPQLEQKFGKDQILEFYCNGNFYAHGCYGVGAASRYYFNKTAAELEPWEAAVLVGISNRPASYEPVNHSKNSLRKRNEVLNSMYACGDLTEAELKEYQAKPLEIYAVAEESTPENYQTSYAIYCAAQQLLKNDGFEFQYTFDTQDEYEAYQTRYKEAFAEKSEAVRSGGYKIYTTLDSSIQQIAQQQLDDALDARSDERQENGKYALQGAAVVVDNASGTVTAIVGGRGTEDVYNRGFLAKRQPGSSIKPLLDYAPAFETGYFYPSYLIDDHEFEGGPKNSGGSYHGYLPIREALNRSLNTVAWQLLQKVGIRNGLAYLGKMEFSSLSWKDSSAAAVSIGGFTYGTRVVDMAKGYATLANGGVYDERSCLRSLIYDRSGDELLQDNLKKVQVYTDGTAYMITDVLKGTMDMPYGTGRGLDISGQQAAGKTGTANDSKDTWFCGYTPYYTTAVWIGYDTPRAMPGIYGATVSGRIWNRIMSEIHEGLPEKDWRQPSSVIEAWVDYDTGAQVSYNSGIRDYFNTAVNPAAKSAYEAVNGTSEYDPNAYRWREEDTLPESSSSEEDTLPEELPPDYDYEPITGVDGGPGVSPSPPSTTAEVSAAAAPTEHRTSEIHDDPDHINPPPEEHRDDGPSVSATVAPAPHPMAPDIEPGGPDFEDF